MIVTSVATVALVLSAGCSATGEEKKAVAPAPSPNLESKLPPKEIASAFDSSMSRIEMGQQLSFDRKKGNCLACHSIEGGVAPGNIGPPLVAMKVRYPVRADLRQQIWDPTIANPESSMLPFGKHGILSEAELEEVVDFIWTL
jgi:sulfur-oxidizing protein SoxX